MMHLKPNACTRTARPDARIGMGYWPLALETDLKH
jgi:hypothetical protein